MPKTLLALSLCFIICSVCAAEAEKTVKTIKDAILRSDSTVFSSQIATLPAETKVKVLKERYDWYKVQLPSGTSGFVHSDYIQTTGHKSGYSKATSLNIRTGPSLDAEVIGSLKLQDEVEIIGRNNAWYKIKAYPYSSAWINQKSVVILTEGPSPKPIQEITQKTPQERAEMPILKTSPAEAQEAPIEKLAELIKSQQKTPPIATGILKPAGKFFSFVNYKLENENGIISLKVPVTLWPHQFLYKKVDIWGNFDESRNYLVVEKIDKSSLNPDIKKVKEELRQINQTLKAAVDMPDKP